MNRTITAVPGVSAGHASYAAHTTGCTVLLGPFRAAVDVRGLATGTREMDTLSPRHLVPQIDALLLTGGSALGLAAADGVVGWLREHGRGFDVGPVRIPIVPAAVIFDISRQDQRHPDAPLGRAACTAASTDPLEEGRVGAGTGATVGKIRGPVHASPGGVGTFAVAHGAYTIGAIAVVNAFGDVLERDGSIIAGARKDDGSPLDSMVAAASGARAAGGAGAGTGAGAAGSGTGAGSVDGAADAGAAAAPLLNTTLCAIATDAPLSRTALQTLARMGSSAIVRRIAPANTVFDGDVVFALSTSSVVSEMPPGDLLSMGTAAQLALEEAIVRAVSQPQAGE